MAIYFQPGVHSFTIIIRDHVEDVIILKNTTAYESYCNKNYQQAIECLNEAIKFGPFCAFLYYNRALCYTNLNNMKNAYLDARESVKLNSIFRHTKLFIQIAIEWNKIDNAICFLDSLGFTESKKFLEELKRFEYILENDKGDKSKLLSSSTACALKCPGCKRYLLERTEALIINGEYATVNYILRDDLNGDIRAKNYIMGLMYLYRENNIDKALNQFYLALFEELFTQNDLYVKAKTKYDSIKKLKEKKELGNDAYNRFRLQEAYDLYTEALNIDEWMIKINAQLHFNRGLVLIAMGKKNEALTDLNNALQLQPNYVKALLRRARLFLDLDNLENAIIDFEKAFTLSSQEITPTLLSESKNQYYSALLKKCRICLDSENYKQIMRLCLKSYKFDFGPQRKQELGDIFLNAYQRLMEENFGKPLTTNIKKLTFNGANLEEIEKLLEYGTLNDLKKHYETFFNTKLNKKEDPIYKKEAFVKMQQIAQEYLEKGLYKEALDYYEQISKMNVTVNDIKSFDCESTYLRAFLKCGKQLYDNGDYDRPIKAFETIIFEKKISDKNKSILKKCENIYIRALIEKAKYLLDKVMFQEAINCYSKICKINGKSEYKTKLYELQHTMKIFNSNDNYDILDVTETTNLQGIKKAYHKLSKIHHPDRHSNKASVDRILFQTEIFKKILSAYQHFNSTLKK